jgi:hypothetical protein
MSQSVRVTDRGTDRHLFIHELDTFGVHCEIAIDEVKRAIGERSTQKGKK